MKFWEALILVAVLTVGFVWVFFGPYLLWHWIPLGWSFAIWVVSWWFALAYGISRDSTKAAKGEKG